MRKLFVTCCLLLYATNANGVTPCNMKITNGEDSGFTSVPLIEDSRLDPIRVVEDVVYRKCGETLRVDEVLCAFFKPGDINTKVCYIETKYGYFYVSIDYMNNANVVFSRWD